MTAPVLDGLELRLLDPADAATADELVGYLAREWGTSTTEDPVRRWTRLVADRSHADRVPFTLVAHLPEGVAGCVQVCTDDVDARHADRGPWLSAVYVAGPARNLGVGRAMLAEAERLTAAFGHTELWLHTGEAHRFYTRCGYTVVEPKTSVDTDAVLFRTLLSP